MTFMLFAIGVLAHFAISQKQDIAQVLVRPDIIILGFTYGSQKDAWGYVTYVIPLCVVGFILAVWMWPLKGRQPVMYGNGKVLFAACKELSIYSKLPANGIQWGDIGVDKRSGKRRAGFAKTPTPLQEGAEYI
jgi:hypothetical protein